MLRRGLADGFHHGAAPLMFLIRKDRPTHQIRRRSWKVNPGSTAAKRAMEGQMPTGNNPENSDESQVKAFDVVLIESLFQQLGMQDMKPGERLDGSEILN